MRQTLIRALALSLLVFGGVAVIQPAVASADTPTYQVMNTSEYPPDGIYFRDSPDWNNTRRIDGYGVFAGDYVRLNCYDYGTNVPRPDGGSNTVWYQVDNVSRPSSPAGGNSGWLNAHFVNDGTGANQVAPGVIRCGTAPPPPPPPAPTFDRVATTDQLLFNSSMATFLQARNAKLGGSALDWTTDGCSNPALVEPSRSQPRGYDFRPACWRHDFGYRNYKKQGRFNETVRKRIDVNFHNDMYAVCNTFTGWRAARGVECRRIADTYYNVVRALGGT